MVDPRTDAVSEMQLQVLNDEVIVVDCPAGPACESKVVEPYVRVGVAWNTTHVPWLYINRQVEVK